MNQEFSVGEMAIYVRPNSPHYGKEIEILGPLQFVSCLRDHVTGALVDGGMRYQITRLDDLPRFWAKPEWLRKKRPPQELSSWYEVEKLCGWNPEKQLCRS